MITVTRENMYRIDSPARTGTGETVSEAVSDLFGGMGVARYQVLIELLTERPSEPVWMEDIRYTLTTN